ncbi:MAG TPA: ribonuclease Z [Candidatus Nanoarchaeia archaeon]|nr:ribonuclease Z [Candidatus Nanoarchaeia archaeon]
MEIILLGTSSMVPTANRNHTAALLRHHDETILIDCGEGTQRQFRKAKISPTKMTRILITHWHGDHVLGLPGLIMTLAANHYGRPLLIYGPQGTKANLEKMFSFFATPTVLSWKAHDIDSGVVFESDDLQIVAYPVKHGIPTLAYRFVEKDKRKIHMDKLGALGVKPGKHIGQLQHGNDITYNGKTISANDVTSLVKGRIVSFVMDTMFCLGAIDTARDADLLICEATYTDEMKDEAAERRHMTATDAARIAKEANVKKLVLTHFSQRYKDVSVHEQEAKDIFPETIVGEDFMTISVEFS